MSEVKLEDIVSLCKRRGFIFQGSEVYGGLAGTWDYGPLGVQLKRNIMNLWWQMFVDDRDDMVGVDAAILMNQKVWQASGHVDTFTDPLIDCNNCGKRYRSDHLVKSYENQYNSLISKLDKDVKSELSKLESKVQNEYQSASHIEKLLSKEEVASLMDSGKVDDFVLNKIAKIATMRSQVSAVRATQKNLDLAKAYQGESVEILLNTYVKCENCGHKEWGTARQFNMMFKTTVGPVEDENSISYLRPETAQGIFTNFKNVVDTLYPDVPFGIAQQGKAFRNEISPRDFVFRSREFEQMEIEYFVHPEKWEESFEAWQKAIYEWFERLGLPKDMVHELEVPEGDRAHYSKRTIDFEFDFPHGRDELLGLAYRTDFDLSNIQRASGKSVEYRPKDGSQPFVPHVIEPSFGVERAIMAVLTAAYKEDEQNGEKRAYLQLPGDLAPVKMAVSPLLKNKPELVEKAREVYAAMKKKYGSVMWDDNGNIGKRYRRQDEIGTPKCVTIDFETLDNDTVTVRDRDTTEQTRIKISEL